MSAKVQIHRETAELALTAIRLFKRNVASEINGAHIDRMAREMFDAAINDLRTALAVGGEGKET